MQIVQKSLHVDLATGQGEHVGAAGEICRDRIGHRTTDAAVYLFTLLTQIEEREVAAHAEAAEEQVLVVFTQGVADDGVQVFSGAAVVEAGLEVHHATTGAEVP